VTNWWPFLREAWASLVAQRTTTIIGIVISAGMCATALLTTGKTIGAEADVLHSFDRSSGAVIVVRAGEGSGLDTTVLTRVTGIEGVRWVGAFGPSSDATNADIEGGALVSVRRAYGHGAESLLAGRLSRRPNGEDAYVSEDAMRQLGLAEPAGGIEDTGGVTHPVVGLIRGRSYLASLQPLVVIPASYKTPQTVSALIVVVRSPDEVEADTQAIESVLSVHDPSKVSVTTDAELEELRNLVRHQLGFFGRDLVVLTLVASGLVQCVIMYGLAYLRRRDFGRRRALGASQGLVMRLLLTQVALLSSAGAAIGDIVSLIVLVLDRAAPPGPEFFAAVDVIAISINVAASVLPALAAARRDPIAELRVP